MDDKIKLMTLIRLVSYVKFDCEDYESSYFAGSPIVGEVLFDLKKKLSSIEGNEISFEVKLDSPFGRTLIKSIKWHLGNAQSWSEMEQEDKIDHIKNLASPYYINDETINMLIVFRDFSSNR